MNYSTQKIGNPNAERTIIWWLLDDWQKKYEWEITEDDFIDNDCLTIYKALEKNKWDVDLAEWELINLWGTALDTWFSIRAMIDSYITTHIESHLEVLKEHTKRRTQLLIADKIKTKIQEWNDADMLEEANKLFQTEAVKVQSRDAIKQEIFDDMFWEWKDIKRFLTNYKDIDSITWGFYPWQLVTISARPGIWKTTLAINFIANQLQVWHKAVFFSLEMPTKEIYQRLYSRFWWLEVWKLKWARKIEAWDMEKYNKAMERVWEFEENLTLFDDKYKLSEIVNQIRLLHNKWICDIVYIDYVGLIEVKAENRNLEISKITRALKVLAIQLKIPIVIMAQLSRAVEKRFGWGDEPILSDLRDSWSIEQDSDVVMMLHKGEDNCLKVLVRKNRNWPLGTAYQLMNARYMQIWDMTEEQKQFYMSQWE